MCQELGKEVDLMVSKATWCRHTAKDPDAGEEWSQEKGTTEDEMVGWHHQLNGHEFGQAPGDGEGQGSLACCSPWGHKESDTIMRLNNNKANMCITLGFLHSSLVALSTFLDWISELAHVGRWTSKKECSQELQPHCIPHSTPFAKKSSLTLQCVLGTQVPLHWESMVWATLSMENIKQNWKERLSTFISVPICLKGRNSF